MKNQSFYIIGTSLMTILLLISCNLPSRPQQATQEVPKTASASLETGGGSITLDSLSIVIGPNNLPAPTTIAIEADASPESDDPNIKAQSDTYALTGLPPDFEGSLQVTFAIPVVILKALQNDPDAAQKITLWVGEPGYSRTAGGVVTSYAPWQDAQVDLEAKKITAQIGLSNAATLSRTGHLARPVRVGSVHNEWWETTPRHLYFKVTAGIFWNSTQNGLFTVNFPRGAYIGPVVDALIESQQKLESLGFSLQPLKVYIEDPGGGRDGLFTWSLLRGYHMAIHPKLLSAGNALPATVGHELMHYAQVLTYEQQGDLDSYSSLDEATAIWFESFILSNPDHLALLADEHIETFLTKPWFSGSAVEMGRAGYGASWYIHYLVRQYGQDVIRQMYNGRHRGGQAAWALGLLDATGSNNDAAFRQFLPAFVFQPGQVSSALVNSSPQYYNNVYERRIQLKRAGEQVTFEAWDNRIPSDPGTGYSTFPGTILGDSTIEYSMDPEPGFSVSRTLYPWNGYYIFMRMDPSMFPYDEGQLDVSVTASGANSGVMIYGIPVGGTTFDARPIHGPQNYLSGEGFTIVDKLSHSKGSGDYYEIVFILFNSGEESAEVILNVTFGPAKPVELHGEAQVTRRTYPEDVCDGLSCCSSFTNPPSCVYDSGGGGGGDGEDSACDKPCPEVPDFCYWCSEEYGASLLLSVSPTHLTISLDEDGKLAGIDFRVYGEPIQTIIRADGGEAANGQIAVEWIINDVLNGKPAIHVSLDGRVTVSGGSGTWSLSYDGVGEMVTGTWAVVP